MVPSEQMSTVEEKCDITFEIEILKEHLANSTVVFINGS
jgi:hypothetical protein